MKTRGIYGEPVYLSLRNSRVLWLIAKRMGPRTDEQGLSRVMTADEIADEMLTEAIEEKHLDALQFIEAQDKRERDFINTPEGKK